MAIRRIGAIIDAAALTVRFRAEPGVPRNLTFSATRGDTLRWELTGGEGLSASVQFTSPPASPVAESQPLTASGRSITGSVHARAANGEYHYDFRLQGPGLPITSLKCFWEDDPVPTPMGGGVITGPPPD